MPFADATFDAAHVNGFVNLCPDKAVAARELLRVLKVGGRAVGGSRGRRGGWPGGGRSR